MPQSWAELQVAFAVAVMDPSRPVPFGVVGREGTSDQRRFAVYRNNVMVSLVDALQARFPATCRLVGEEFFRAMARAYAVDCLPRSPLLMQYGDSFPAFIDRFESAASVAYLADVARVEVAWSGAYHAADATPLGLDILRTAGPAELANAIVELHPSVRLVRSSYPIAAIWHEQQQEVVTPVSQWHAEDVLVLRPDATVSVHVLTEGVYEFLAVLQERRSILEAGKTALSVSPQFDLGRCLVDLLSLGVIVAVGSATAHSE